MKKNNKNTIITVITASLLLLATGCSQAAETVDIIVTDPTYESSVTTINTEAETSVETTVQTTAAHTTTAAQTTAAVTTVPVTEAQPVTVQTEAAPVPVSTTTTKAAPAATKTTTTTTTSKPEEPAHEDRSYLNLTPSEVQYILDECAKYAQSLGYTVMTYTEYNKAIEELDKAFYELKGTNEGYQKYLDMCHEFDSLLKCITDVPTEEFWSGNWHYIMYAGNFTKKYENSFELWGYDTHCSTKEESIQHIIGYLKYWIDDERSDNYQTGGRSISITGTKLRTFDNYAKEKGSWGLVSYETIRQEYTANNVYDLDTSYAFSVKSM